MIDLLTHFERELVETCRDAKYVSQVSIVMTLVGVVDRLAPKPLPKTDQELADMIDKSLHNTYGNAHLEGLREVRDALRARGTK